MQISTHNLSLFQKKLSLSFNNQDLLVQALTHRSYLNENPNFRTGHNERLEFLGDAVLELAVTEFLYDRFPERPEGELTSLRAALVNSRMLADMASSININDHLFLSRGETKDVGRARQYILANAFEALVGAIYLDQGFERARRFIEETVLQHLDDVIQNKLYRDPKSLFQEEAQERVGITPSYEVLKEWGPDHEKQFVIGVFLGKDLVAEGQGHSKQAAQEQAATNALAAKGWG